MNQTISRILASPGLLRIVGICLAILFISFVPDVAYAADELMPYEGTMKKFKTSLEGPVPFAISLVGIVACGAMLIFGGEISGFMRTMVFLVMVIAVIVQASTVVTFLGGKEQHEGSTVYASPVEETSRNRA